MPGPKDLSQLYKISMDETPFPVLWVNVSGKVIGLNKASRSWEHLKSLKNYILKNHTNFSDRLKKSGTLLECWELNVSKGKKVKVETKSIHTVIGGEDYYSVLILNIVDGPTEIQHEFISIFNNSGYLSLLLDAETGKIKQVNPAVIKTLGYSNEELIGKEISIILEGCTDYFSGQNTIREAWTEEFECKTKSGGVIYTEVSASPIDFVERQFVLCMMRDVGARKLVEKALKYRLRVEEFISKTSTRFLNLTDTELDVEINKTLKEAGVLVKSDRCYVYTFVKNKFLNTHEWVKKGAEPMMEMQNSEDPKVFAWIHNQLYENKTVHIPSLDTIPASQKQLIENLQKQGIKSTLAVPIKSSAGLIGFLGFDNLHTEKSWSEEDIGLLKVIGEVFANALERKGFEANLQKANSKLQDLNKHLEKKVEERTSSLTRVNNKLMDAIEELDLFVYRAAHDLKGPIKRILGLSKTAEHDCNELISGKYIEMFKHTAMGMDRSLSKLLIANSISKYLPHYADVNIERLINKNLEEIATYLDTTNVSMHLPDSGFTIYTNEYLISIILSNLLENALCFSRYADKPEISITCDVFGPYHRLQIKDNGIGIEDSVKGRVFEMFYRGSNDSIGTGLGLYLVDRAVEKLNGEISIDSQPDLYTNVTLMFPKLDKSEY